MAKPNVRPRVGDTCWVVEWTHELAWVNGDSTGADREIDTDRCQVRKRACPSRADAERLAREVYPQTVGVLGFVDFYEVEFLPYDEADAARYPTVGYWSVIGDTYEFSGEDVQALDL